MENKGLWYPRIATNADVGRKRPSERELIELLKRHRSLWFEASQFHLSKELSLFWRGKGLDRETKATLILLGELVE